MSKGLGGWTGEDVGLEDTDEGDLPFWRWDKVPGRIQHTGAFVIGGKSGLLEVMHASSSHRTVVIQELRGVLKTNLRKIRRLKVSSPTKK